MAIVEDIKCPRCDRKYSGVRSRCPYCGARRIGFGKYSKDNDNAKGKMIISVLILAVFTVAAGVMMLSTPVDDKPDEILNPTPDLSEIIDIPVLETPTPSPTPLETPTPPPVLLSAQIWVPRSHNVSAGFHRSLDPNNTRTGGGPIELTANLEPPSIDIPIRWDSTNEPDDPVFEIEEVTGGIRVIPKRTGTATLILEAGDIKVNCPITIVS